MKIALKLAYLGDNYYGFQRQPDLVTVDSEVRKALAQDRRHPRRLLLCGQDGQGRLGPGPGHRLLDR